MTSLWEEHEAGVTALWEEHEAGVTSLWEEREAGVTSLWKEHEAGDHIAVRRHRKMNTGAQFTSPFYSVQHPSPQNGITPIRSLPFSFKPLWTYCHTQAQMCDSWVILTPVKLTAKIKHHII